MAKGRKIRGRESSMPPAQPDRGRRSIPAPAERRRLLTIYGRKAVLEALQDTSLDCGNLHLADSNRPAQLLKDIEDLANRRGLERRYHSREALARISRNSRQDQGVALDVRLQATRELDDYLTQHLDGPQVVLGLDGVTNPQNLGMIIRSAAASGIHGLLLPDRGAPALGPLVIKASAGTLFRAPLLRCTDTTSAARQLIAAGFTLYRFEAGGQRQLFDRQPLGNRILLMLGGETDGLSPAIQALPGESVAIPMANGVESLNVAVSAALAAYAAMTSLDR